MRRPRVWIVALLVAAAWLLAGCASDVVMVDPRTGARATCHESAHGLDPWSQMEACVGDYMTRGWTRATPD
jgi:uncharacterized membrane protein